MAEPYPVSEAGPRQRHGARAEAYPVPTKASAEAYPVPTSVEFKEKKKRDAFLGPSQRAQLRHQEDPPLRPVAMVLALSAALFALVSAWVVSSYGVTLAELPRLVLDVATLTRTPQTALDNAAAVYIILIALPALLILDVTVCKAFCSDSGARWFLLHALGNGVVAALALPDFFHVAANPPAAMSAAYCSDLPFPACSDWPTCLIISMHIYHMLRFRLGPDDLFHHLLFVPIIGGIHFAYPLGASNNILSFFISGFPGGLDYFLLALVKAGRISSFTEKRINCSINTWVRSPGIVCFCTLITSCWLRPYPGTPPGDVMPVYAFVPTVMVRSAPATHTPWRPSLPPPSAHMRRPRCTLLTGRARAAAACTPTSCTQVIFFNGQYYAQRVIGNYYIKKTQMLKSQGIEKVDLHAS